MRHVFLAVVGDVCIYWTGCALDILDIGSVLILAKSTNLTFGRVFCFVPFWTGHTRINGDMFCFVETVVSDEKTNWTVFALQREIKVGLGGERVFACFANSTVVH